MNTHLLILRFSALGDILMTIPVVDALAHAYPNLEITVASKPNVASLFKRLPKNVHFFGVDFKGTYNGLSGLSHLYHRLSEEDFTHVADLHDVLRTKYLRMRFTLAGMFVAHINKERASRKEFLHASDKTQQKTSFQKYAEVFSKLGFPIEDVSFRSLFADEKGPLEQLPEPLHKRILGYNERGVNQIGIAPFAAHQGKIYPLDKMENVVETLSQGNNHVYLFGSGKQELDLLHTWSKKYPHVETVADNELDLYREAVLISHIRVMLTMDSANMHLASLVNTPVLSIWGATHPYAGFLGWNQKTENVLQVTDLPCRPCSIYGSKPCKYKDYPCLNRITPQQVLENIERICKEK